MTLGISRLTAEDGQLRRQQLEGFARHTPINSGVGGGICQASADSASSCSIISRRQSGKRSFCATPSAAMKAFW